MHMSHDSKSDRRDKSHSDRRMREKEIEQKLVKAVKGRGGICPKLVCPAYAGMPDRMALIPGGRVGFVEVKAPGKVPRPCSWRDTRCSGSLVFRCMCWMSQLPFP